MTRPERITRGAGYLAVGTVGLWTILNPPTAIGTALGHALTLFWCACMCTAYVGAIASMLGRYRAEYVSLPWFGGAVMIAVLHIWVTLYSHHSGNVTVALLTTALLTWYVCRFIALSRLIRDQTRKPRRWTRSRLQP